MTYDARLALLPPMQGCRFLRTAKVPSDTSHWQPTSYDSMPDGFTKMVKVVEAACPTGPTVSSELYDRPVLAERGLEGPPRFQPWARRLQFTLATFRA